MPAYYQHCTAYHDLALVSLSSRLYTDSIETIRDLALKKDNYMRRRGDLGAAKVCNEATMATCRTEIYAGRSGYATQGPMLK